MQLMLVLILVIFYVFFEYSIDGCYFSVDIFQSTPLIYLLTWLSIWMHVSSLIDGVSNLSVAGVEKFLLDL